MSESDKRTKTRPTEARKKAYTRPKLTEYGSVAKLTMSSGSTTVEGPGTKKKGMACL